MEYFSFVSMYSASRVLVMPVTEKYLESSLEYIEMYIMKKF